MVDEDEGALDWGPGGRRVDEGWGARGGCKRRNVDAFFGVVDGVDEQDGSGWVWFPLTVGGSGCSGGGGSSLTGGAMSRGSFSESHSDERGRCGSVGGGTLGGMGSTDAVRECRFDYK